MGYAGHTVDKACGTIYVTSFLLWLVKKLAELHTEDVRPVVITSSPDREVKWLIRRACNRPIR